MLTRRIHWLYQNVSSDETPDETLGFAQFDAFISIDAIDQCVNVHVSTDLHEHEHVGSKCESSIPIMAHQCRKFDRSAIFLWVGYLSLTEWNMRPKFRKFGRLVAILYKYGWYGVECRRYWLDWLKYARMRPDFLTHCVKNWWLLSTV